MGRRRLTEHETLLHECLKRGFRAVNKASRYALRHAVTGDEGYKRQADSCTVMANIYAGAALKVEAQLLDDAIAVVRDETYKSCFDCGAELDPYGACTRCNIVWE